jgi:hypothetical protein
LRIYHPEYLRALVERGRRFSQLIRVLPYHCETRRSLSARMARMSAVFLRFFPVFIGQFVLVAKIVVGEQSFPGSRAVDDELVSGGTGEIDRKASQDDGVAHDG